jgi:hypothetical protein
MSKQRFEHKHDDTPEPTSESKPVAACNRRSFMGTHYGVAPTQSEGGNAIPLSTPTAFAEMLRGDNFGKMLVQVSPDPTLG